MNREKMKDAFYSYFHDWNINAFFSFITWVPLIVTVLWVIIGFNISFWADQYEDPISFFYWIGLPLIILSCALIIFDSCIKYLYFEDIDTYHELILIFIPGSYIIIAFIMVIYALFEKIVLSFRDTIESIEEKRQEIKIYKIETKEKIKIHGGMLSISETDNMDGALTVKKK